MNEYMDEPAAPATWEPVDSEMVDTAEGVDDYTRLQLDGPAGAIAVAPIRLTDVVLQVALPAEVVVWRYPDLVLTAGPDHLPVVSGQSVAVVTLALNAQALHGMASAAAGTGFDAEGRWPAAAGLRRLHVEARIAPRELAPLDTRYLLPPSAPSLAPAEFDTVVGGMLGAGPHWGLLALEWPPREPLSEGAAAVGAALPEAGGGYDARGEPEVEFGDVGESPRGRGAVLPEATPRAIDETAVVGAAAKAASRRAAAKAGTAAGARGRGATAALGAIEERLAEMVRSQRALEERVARAERARLGEAAQSGPPGLGGGAAAGGATAGPGTWPADVGRGVWPPPGPELRGAWPPAHSGAGGRPLFAMGGEAGRPDLGAAAVRSEVGPAPRSLAGPAPFGRGPSGLDLPPPRSWPEGGNSLAQTLAAALLSAGDDLGGGGFGAASGGGGGAGGAEHLGGARGAQHYAREKSRFEGAPEAAFRDLQRRSREQLGSAGGAPTNFPALLQEVPFDSFNTLRRTCCLLLHLAQAEENQDRARVRGLIAQGIRWTMLGAQVPRDPLLAWRLTFLPDPVPMSQPRRSPGGLDLNSSILDPAQLTAVLGMARDMELLNRRLESAGNGEKGDREGHEGGGGESRRQRPAQKKGAGKGEGGGKQQ